MVPDQKVAQGRFEGDAGLAGACQVFLKLYALGI